MVSQCRNDTAPPSNPHIRRWPDCLASRWMPSSVDSAVQRDPQTPNPKPNHLGRDTVQLALRLRYVTLMLLFALIKFLLPLYLFELK